MPGMTVRRQLVTILAVGCGLLGPMAAQAAGASLAIGAATLWFGNMLNRVPLDQHATLSYLLMLPLLLIVPAFSGAGLRLAWLSWY